MRRRPLPVFVLSVGFALLAFTALRPLFAQPPAPAPALVPDDPAHYPKVRVETTTGSSALEGKLKLAAITLKTDTGSTTVGMGHVKRITFQKDPEGKSNDSVQLTDKSAVRGHVTDEVFVVEIPGGEARLKKTEVREIKVVNEEKMSLVAVLLGLLTLTAMEIVLGVDNIIFLAIIAGRLPKEQQPRARKVGLAAALGTRLLLLLSISFLLGLTTPLFTLPHFGVLHDMEAREVSWRDLILLAGGLFLIGKSTHEMHAKVEEAKAERDGQPVLAAGKAVSFAWTIVTIAVIDIVFSLDSVITAVGMAQAVIIMIAAMIIAVIVMLVFADAISEFIGRHPSMKILALAFLLLIGFLLVADAFGHHINKGYVYFAMAFALGIEVFNMRVRKKARAHAKGNS